MNDNKAFAQRVSELRRSRMLSQKEFGEILGVSNKAVSKWETGESMPQMKTIIKMAEFFEISPDELMVGKKYDENKTVQQAAVSSDLAEENAKLKSQLNSAVKDKNKIRGFGMAVCAILLTVILIVVLYNHQDNYTIHNQSEFIGAENSVVEFGGKVFYKGNTLEQLVYNDCPNPEIIKDAVIKAENKKENIQIYCEKDLEYIIVPKDKKDFVYVENTGLGVTDESIMSFYIIDGETLADIESPTDSESLLANHLYYDYDYDYDFYDFTIDSEVSDVCKIYNQKKLVKNKDLAKRFMKDDSDVLIAEFINGNCTMVKLGKLFEDDKGNTYLFSFLDSNIYKLEGRIS